MTDFAKNDPFSSLLVLYIMYSTVNVVLLVSKESMFEGCGLIKWRETVEANETTDTLASGYAHYPGLKSAPTVAFNLFLSWSNHTRRHNTPVQCYWLEKMLRPMVQERREERAHVTLRFNGLRVHKIYMLYAWSWIALERLRHCRNAKSCVRIAVNIRSTGIKKDRSSILHHRTV